MRSSRLNNPRLPVRLAKLGTPVLALFALAGGLAQAGADFRLEVTGNEQARVAITCTITDGAGERTVAIADKPPVRRRFGGDALACTVRQTAAGGRVSLVLESAAGNVSRISTGGRGSDVTLRIE
jgi:hypothetical protein